jgi:hypothetical protein
MSVRFCGLGQRQNQKFEGEVMKIKVKKQNKTKIEEEKTNF